MNDNPSPVSIRPFLFQFTGIYLAVSITVMAFVYFIDFNLPSFVGMSGIMVAAMTSGQSFASKHLRLMSPSERLKFALLAALFAFVGSFALVAVLFVIFSVPFSFNDIIWTLGLSDITDWVWIPILLFVFMLIAIVTYFSVNITAKITLKKLTINQGRN